MTTEECPKCKHDLGIALFRYFHNQADYSTHFEYTCPNCKANLNVEVIPIPEFNLSLANKQEQPHAQP